MNRIILAALLAAGVALSARAQTYQDSGGTVVPGVVPIQPGVGPLFTSANPGKISGSFSASLSGFQPTPSYASLSVGATSSRVALPSGTVVVVYNTGTNAAYVTIGGASVTATTSNDFVPAGGWMAFAVGSSAYLAGIETAGATTLNLSGGSGLPTGACCAAGGAGSGSKASVGSTGSAVPGSATLGGMSVGGTMTAMPGTSNGLKIDGSAVTQPVSAASLPLPTGAATAAGQPTVAGNGSTTSGQTGNLDMAAVTSSSPAYTNGQTNALSLNTAGALRVDGSAVTQPVSAASLPLPTGAATAVNQTNGSQVTTLAASAANGAATNSACSAIAPASLTTAQTCKASAGTVYDIQITSNVASGSGAYLKFYDAASPPTCGASAGTPVGRYPVPANATSSNEGGATITFPVGKAFVNGIYWCATGGLADNDATALTANTVAVNVDFK